MSTVAPVRTIVIVGFGLIGASVAAALRSRDPSVQLIAVDQASVVEEDEVRKRVDDVVDAENQSEIERQFALADLVLLSAPIHVIEAQLPIALAHARCVTDCGSTKRRIVDVASTCPQHERFVPGHPMAGASKGGYHAAKADLFEGRSWLLCPGVAAPAHEQLVRQFVGFLGAQTEDLSPMEHDKAVALTSHLPQLLASMLAVLCEEQGAGVAAGPGFASATRVAGGNPAIWKDIFESNADQIAAVSESLAGRLGGLTENLLRGDVREVIELLDAARRARSGRKFAR